MDTADHYRYKQLANDALIAYFGTDGMPQLGERRSMRGDHNCHNCHGTGTRLVHMFRYGRLYVFGVRCQHHGSQRDLFEVRDERERNAG